MIFAVIGGDERSVRLCRLLREAGHEALPFALEGATACGGDALARCEAALLPLPCVRGGHLNAPLSGESWEMEPLLRRLRAGTPVLAGQAGPIRALCAGLGLPVYDYYGEELAVKNAALTAEGAVSLLLAADGRALAGRRVLLTGFGRIGRLLALKLTALGAEVTAAARSWPDLAWAESLGCRALPLGKALTAGGDYDFVVNTIPAPVLDEATLARLGRPALLELASAPYGIDAEAALSLGLSYTLAAGLPGKVAPESAAAAIRDAVEHLLSEPLPPRA